MKLFTRPALSIKPLLAKRRRWFSDEIDPAPEAVPSAEKDAITLPRSAFNDRLERAKASGQAELLKTLGFEHVDALQARLRAGEEAGGKLSELDALRQQITSLTETVAQREAQVKEAETQRRALEIDTQLTSFVTELKGRDLEVILALLKREDIMTDDTLDNVKARQAVISLRDSKPYLFQIGVGSPSNVHEQKPSDVNTLFKKPIVGW